MPTLAERLRKDGEIRLNSPVELMRFTLVYDGNLPTQSRGNRRTTEKQQIREALHKQLAELWNERPPLRRALAYFAEHGTQRPLEPMPELPADLGDYRAQLAQAQRGAAAFERLLDGREKGILVPFERGNFTFVPLATIQHSLVCELDILFLRAEPPGTLFTNEAGDLDNRLKVLFDALTLPNPDQLGSTDYPSLTQRPFFCLLQDDKQITAVRVESDRLLDEPERSSRVKLVVRVTMKARRIDLATLEIEGD